MSNIEPSEPQAVRQVTLSVFVKCRDMADALRLLELLRANANSARLVSSVISERTPDKAASKP